MSPIKKAKIIIINRSGLKLYVRLSKSGQEGTQNYEVKNRSVFRLHPARYKILLYYDCRTLVLETKGESALEVGDMPAPCNNKFLAKMVVLNFPRKTTKIVCREQVSVASILEKSPV